MARRDLIVALGFVTLRDMRRRPRSYPVDRLVHALIEGCDLPDSLGRVLVADPYRTVGVRLKRRLAGVPNPEAPPGGRVTFAEPKRLGRRDPTRIRRAARVYTAYGQALRRSAEASGLTRPAVLTDNPLAAGFADLSWAEAVTYYAWDDWAAHPSFRRWSMLYERAYGEIRERGHAVCAVSQTIVDRIRPKGPAAVVPNGIDPSEWLAPAPPPAWYAALPHPRFIYVGTLDRRIDVQAVAAVADAFPQGSVALVGGGADDEQLHPLRGLPNVHIHGSVARDGVCGLVGASDVGLVPHVSTDLTRAMSPLKLYEYLAAGLPVAAAELAPMRGVSDRVVLCGNGDFAAAAGAALNLGRSTDQARRRFIDQNAWSRRHAQILELSLAPS